MKTLMTQLPETLSRQVEQVALKDPVSLDQFAKDSLRERAERGSWAKFPQALAKSPDVAPIAGKTEAEFQLVAEIHPVER